MKTLDCQGSTEEESLTRFHISALPARDLDRIRRRGSDDFGNELVVTIQEEAEAPLRCCLRDATVGERVALMAWQPAEVGGAARLTQLRDLSVREGSAGAVDPSRPADQPCPPRGPSGSAASRGQ